MTPIAASIEAADNGSLAAIHYTRGLVPHQQACYVCHSGYGIWGTVNAKADGIMHMLRTVAGRYEFPIKLRRPFDIDSYLCCHAYAPRSCARAPLATIFRSRSAALLTSPPA